MNDAARFPAETVGRRFGTLAAGVTFMYVTNKLFDYLLYPYVVYRAGLLLGGLVMTALSAVACLAILRFYDRTKQDWLGIETIRGLKDYRGGRRAARLISRLLSKSDAAAFVALSLYHDPFITTVWLRRERFGGLSPRDRRIFWGSVLLGNAFWTLSCWLGANAAVWVWRWIRAR